MGDSQDPTIRLNEEDDLPAIDTSGLDAEDISAHHALPNDFARYDDFEMIDSGGMGQIFRATDPRIGRSIAIKTLRTVHVSDRKAVKRFQQEVRITGQLEHPNIVPIYDMGKTENTHFFCMKLVEGQSLAQILNEEHAALQQGSPPYDGRRHLPTFLKVCDAISFAHSRDIVHRDLKPANIMIGAFGEVLVMDWGIAKNMKQTQDLASPSNPVNAVPLQDSMDTVDGAIVGTLNFMSPEQAEGRIDDIDSRSDIYCLGIILYHMLTLHPPFRGATPIETIIQVSRGVFIPPSRCPRGGYIPNDLEAVVLKAMALDKESRYPSIVEMQQDIQAYLEGRTLGAASYTPIQIASKWIARNRKVVHAVLCVLILAAAAFTALRWNSHNTLQNRYREALLSAEEHRQSIANIKSLCQRQNTVDLSTGMERRDTPSERSQRENAIEHYVAAAGDLDRALLLKPGDALAQRRRQVVAIAIGQMALSGRDYLLAKQAFLQLETLEYSPKKIRAFLHQVRDAETELLDWRHQRIQAILEIIDRGLSHPARKPGSPLLPDFVFEVLSYRDPQTVGIMEENLQHLILKARRDRPEPVWSKAERDRATFLCRVLGRIGLPGCVSPLASWMGVVQDPQLAVEAGLALCNTRHPDAQKPLGQASNRFGASSPVWQQILPFFSRIPSSETDAEPETAGQHYGRGLKLQNRGNFEQALVAQTRAIELNPRHNLAYNARGRIRRSLGDMNGALADFDRAIELDPKHGHTYNNRGNARLANGDPNGALEDFNRAIELDPNPIGHFIGRGNARRMLKDLDGAIADYSRVLRFNPRFHMAYNNRGSTYHEKRDFDAALSDFNRAIELNPKYTSAYFNRGKTFQAKNRFDSAFADYNQALELNPRYWKAWWQLGILLAQRGQRAQALEALEKTRALAPPRFRSEIEQQIRRIKVNR